MRLRSLVILLMLARALTSIPTVWAQQKPFTQEQVSNMVRDGFGDDSGAKLIEQRGIDFVPTEDFLKGLKAAGASDIFLNALHAPRPAQPASAAKPLNQVQILALLAGGVPAQRVAMLVTTRGLDFDVKDLRDDVVRGYVSRRAARDDYGVAFKDDLSVDADATAKLRAKSEAKSEAKSASKAAS